MSSVYGFGLCSLVALLTFGCGSHAHDELRYSKLNDIQDSRPTRDAVLEFLDKHVIGKKLGLAGGARETTLPGTNVRSKFDREVGFSDLEKTDLGLSYNSFFVVRQTLSRPQPDGTYSDENNDRVSMGHCEFRVSESAADQGWILGYCREDMNTGVDHTGGFFSAMARVRDGVLVVKTASGVAEDCYADQGYYPCAIDNTSVFTVTDGKLSIQTTGKIYKIINIETMERGEGKDITPLNDVER